MSSWINSLPFRSGSGSVDNSGSSNQQQRDKNVYNHVVKYQELELKLKKTGLLSKSQTKKWFVLYEDSHHPLDPKKRIEKRIPLIEDSIDIILDESLEKSGTKKGLSVNDNFNDYDYDYDGNLPARLEYYDSEKNWREGYPPIKSVVLKTCFEINKRNESGGHFIITIFTSEEDIEVVFYNEQEMKIWLDLLLTCKEGGRSLEGRIAQPNFESVWSVDVASFTPIESGSTGFSMSGPHRLCFKEGCLLFYPFGCNDNPKTFPIKGIRKSGTDKKNFILITGSSTVSGVGELKTMCKDRETAENLDEEFLNYVKKMRQNQNTEPRRQRRQSRPPRTCETLQFGSRESGIPTPSGSLTSGSLSLRSRSYSDCNKKGTPSTQFQATAPNVPLSSYTQGAIPRTRTVSEGNSHFEIHTRGSRSYPHRSVASGSPLSPGSFVSSESAGSSNSVDSDTVTTGFDSNRYASTLMTSIDTTTTTTIIEESSAESCIDPANFKKDKEDLCTSQIHRQEVDYTPVEVVSASITIPSNYKNTLSYAASPPGGGGVQYTSIINSTDIPNSGSDYMVMTPQSTTQNPNSECTSCNSSRIRPNEAESDRMKLHLLCLDDSLHPEGFQRNLGSTTNNPVTTSPSSQSSYVEEESYLVMSPLSTCSSSGGSTLPKTDILCQGTGYFHSRSNSDVKDEYVPMSPTGAAVYSRKSSGLITSTMGTSPSVALTSHFSDRLQLFEPSRNKTNDENSYVVMSPQNIDLSKKLDHFKSGSFDSESYVRLPSKQMVHNPRDAFKRSSRCSDDGVIVPLQQREVEDLEDEDTLETYVDFIPPALPKNYTRKSNTVPISSALASGARRGSPYSSLMPGTINSMSRPPGCYNDDDSDNKTAGSKPKSQNRSSNSSISSSTRFIDIPGPNKSRNSPSPNNTNGQSPSSSSTSVTSWLGSLFIRSRSGSVPCKPVFSVRRRHRTQSEGENDKEDTSVS